MRMTENTSGTPDIKSISGEKPTTVRCTVPDCGLTRVLPENCKRIGRSKGPFPTVSGRRISARKVPRSLGERLRNEVFPSTSMSFQYTPDNSMLTVLSETFFTLSGSMNTRPFFPILSGKVTSGMEKSESTKVRGTFSLGSSLCPISRDDSKSDETSRYFLVSA